MNKVDFTQPGGFPLDQNILSAMQTAYEMAGKTSLLGGNLCIISGGEQIGGNVASGIVSIDGEVLPLEGGAVGADIIIYETTTDLLYEDGTTKPSQKTRVAKFGAGGTTYAWADFKRNSPANSVLHRLEKVEQMLKPLVGYVDPGNPANTVYGSWLFWGRPAVEIPTGWEPVPDADWKGRVPVVLDDTQVEFDTVGEVGGSNTHTLTVAELPAHNHPMPTRLGEGSTVAGNVSSYDTATDTTDVNTGNAGSGQAHNNLQPYKVVLFIRYVG